MTARRAFLKTAVAGVLASRGPAGAVPFGNKALHDARSLVAGGGLGRIWLCRIPDASQASAVKFVLGPRPLPILEIDTSAEQTVLLGSEATLAIGRRGVQLFCHATRKIDETSGDLIAFD